MNKKRILVVDDSKTDFHFVNRMLVKNGFEVAHSKSGQNAVSDAKAFKPDCILMDVVMPDMNGFQATRALQKDSDTASIPVVMLSSKSQKTDIIWAQRQGAKAYLIKPIEEKRLVSKLNKVLTR